MAKKNAYTDTLVGPNSELGTLIVADEELAQGVLKELQPSDSHQTEDVRAKVLEEISGDTFAQKIVSFYHDCDQSIQPVYYDHRIKVF